MKEKPLQLIKRPAANLTKGQKELYALIMNKLSRNQAIQYEEAKEIWIAKVCRNVIAGIPSYYDYYHHRNDKDEWVAGYKPIGEEWLRIRVFMWLTSNIGALVLKGYLKIIPMIELT